jgi:hypothetical protein
VAAVELMLQWLQVGGFRVHAGVCWHRVCMWAGILKEYQGRLMCGPLPS